MLLPPLLPLQKSNLYQKLHFITKKEARKSVETTNQFSNSGRIPHSQDRAFRKKMPSFSVDIDTTETVLLPFFAALFPSDVGPFAVLVRSVWKANPRWGKEHKNVVFFRINELISLPFPQNLFFFLFFCFFLSSWFKQRIHEMNHEAVMWISYSSTTSTSSWIRWYHPLTPSLYPPVLLVFPFPLCCRNLENAREKWCFWDVCIHTSRLMSFPSSHLCPNHPDAPFPPEVSSVVASYSISWWWEQRVALNVVCSPPPVPSVWCNNQSCPDRFPIYPHLHIHTRTTPNGLEVCHNIWIVIIFKKMKTSVSSGIEWKHFMGPVWCV